MFAATISEIKRLRELAKLQMEYAGLPVMEKRKKQWAALNTCKPALPVVVVETDTFADYLVFEQDYVCQNDGARFIESVLLKNIRTHELIDDDKVVPDFFPIAHQVDVDYFGISISQEYAKDAVGRNAGYRFSHPIVDLEKDFHKLNPAICSLNHKKTKDMFDFAQDIIGSIMPVVYSGHVPLVDMLEKAIRLMGMEALFIAMHEQPEHVHQLMSYLTGNQVKIMEFYQEKGILTGNTGNHEAAMSSFGFLDESPAGGEPDVAALKDTWLWVEAEESAGISPSMFEEFCLPYYAKAASLAGLIYYGCCEPLHQVWPQIIKEIPHIRKVSVSPWSNQFIMGEYLRGTGIVFSSKPSANYLGSGLAFDEAAWGEHIRTSLDAARGCQYEIIMRDVYQVNGIHTVRKAVEIAKNLVKSHWEGFYV